MRLQNLIIIFLAIALPVIIILSFYVELQVDTASLRARYNDYLIDAAHETIVAFELNTKNNAYSTGADTKLRDIEASLNVFSSRLATSFGSTGASNSYMMAYVPAIVLGLYDGYYIYTPTDKSWDTENKRWKDVTVTHELKQYVYYSREYKKGNKEIVINYSLDNYVAVYYYDKTNGVYESKAGYLEIKPEEDVYNALDTNAKAYYDKALEFTAWFNDVIDKVDPNRNLKISRTNLALPKETSEFNDEKYDVIKNSITNNLVQSAGKYGAEIPVLSETDWELILNNVSLIAFMQGVPVGTTTYNNYTIAVSTENKEFVNENTIYFVGEGANADGSYHRIWCPHLKGTAIKGYNRNEFSKGGSKYDVKGCYYCAVRASNSRISFAENFYNNANATDRMNYNLNLRKAAFYTALATEKTKLVKLSDFINGSVALPIN